MAVMPSGKPLYPGLELIALGTHSVNWLFYCFR